ncbi:hypothetical protein GSF04_07860 [Pseudoalteromonas sp. A22]|uniref:O-antigen polymerase n=1 Tax=Pseudoalteromonas sp. A22 TaxID=327511 RepID=UPI001BA61665|nr:O-antigen polymerase [Pseudoalteromonas sp. A22]QUI62435.1 hypothetical protein GSF04_07860 [Pseudoalteromonas sp. A22]
MYGNSYSDNVIEAYLFSGSLFIFFYSLAFSFFQKCTFGGKATNLFKLFLESPLKLNVNLFFLILGWFLISYFIGVARTGSLLYLFTSSSNAFAEMMALANGKYFLIFMTSGLVYGLLVLIMRKLNDEISFNKVLLFTLSLSFFHFYFSTPATRTWFLLLMLSITFHFYGDINKLSFKKIIYISVSAIVMLPLLVILNFIRQGMSIASASLEINKIMLNFAQFENALILIDKINFDLDFTYFKFLFASISPLSIVPSAILPFQKPRADKEAYLTENIFGDAIDLNFYQEGSTLTYTMPISGYADFGYLGVILTALLFGVTLAFFLKLFRKVGSLKLLIIYLALFSSTAIRFGYEGLISVFYAFLLMYFIQYLFFNLISSFVNIRRA